MDDIGVREKSRVNYAFRGERREMRWEGRRSSFKSDVKEVVRVKDWVDTSHIYF